MLDGNHAFKIIRNIGVTAGIAEMLLQSHDGAVHLIYHWWYFTYSVVCAIKD